MYRRLLENWREYVVKEKTRAGREGVVLPSTIEQVNKYISGDLHSMKYMSFTELEKLGINTRSRHNTPLGIYAYPLIFSIANDFSKGEIPFASENPFIQIFEAQNSSKLLVIDKNGESAQITKENYGQYRNKIKEILSKKTLKEKLEEPSTFYDEIKSYDVEEMIEYSEKKAYFPNKPVSKIWNITRMLSGANIGYIAKWSKMLTNLGFEGVVDFGSKTIHESEPIQAVFFSKGFINHIDTVVNKEKPEEIEKRLDNEDIKNFFDQGYRKGTEIEVYQDRYEDVRLKDLGGIPLEPGLRGIILSIKWPDVKIKWIPDEYDERTSKDPFINLHTTFDIEKFTKIIGQTRRKKE